jgi:tRNA (cmo5U34)-methyltransferase
MKEQVKEQFDRAAKDYDANRRKVIPYFDAFYHTGIDFLDYAGDAPHVLDIGAGTGLFSSMLLKRYPAADVTLIDFSDEMLRVAKERFAGLDHVHYVLDNYFEHVFDQSFDIVISALSIHHLNAGEKADLYKLISSLLNEGGEFVNADQVISRDPGVQGKYEAEWIDLLITNGFTEEQIAPHRARMSLDDPSPVGDQLAWMTAAGFVIADCLFKYNNFAVFYGKK